jgi:hypothetical protein
MSLKERSSGVNESQSVISFLKFAILLVISSLEKGQYMKVINFYKLEVKTLALEDI